MDCRKARGLGRVATSVSALRHGALAWSTVLEKGCKGSLPERTLLCARALKDGEGLPGQECFSRVHQVSRAQTSNVQAGGQVVRFPSQGGVAWPKGAKMVARPLPWASNTSNLI